MHETALPTFRLITLGRIALVSAGVEDVELARRRRKLALLAVIATAAEPLSRESLAQMFWGDEAPERARHSLSDALSDLRRALGRDAIAGRSELVQLRLNGRLIVDAFELENAFEASDFVRVLELSTGEFLSDFTVPGSTEFERWVSERRAYYRSLHERAKNALAQRASDAPPSRQWIPHRKSLAFLSAATAAGVIGFLAAYGFRRSYVPPPSIPVVAITDVWTDPADTSIAWLRAGLGAMIAADIDRVASAGIVAPSVVREGADESTPDSLSDRESIARARHLHANWSASAAVVRKGAEYVVTVTVRDVHSGRVAERSAVADSNILVVADHAAEKVLRALEVGGSGPRLADIETKSTSAYRHFIESEAFRSQGLVAEQRHALDEAITADSGFTSAIAARLQVSDSAEHERLVLALAARGRSRLTEWDRRSLDIIDAEFSSHPRQSEALESELAARYPRDPRAWRALGEMYTWHASFAAAESAYTRLLALDSAAAEKGAPCWTCDAYQGLVTIRHLRRDYAGELAAARAWTQARPASAPAWLAWGNALAMRGEFDAASPAFSRYRQLRGTAEQFDDFNGRLLIHARRYDEAESYARQYLHSAAASDAYDLLEAVYRERGQFRSALAAFDAQAAAHHPGINLVRAHTLGAIGNDRLARDIFERETWHPVTSGNSAFQYARRARGFAWTHALEADVLWQRTDTTALRTLADSVQMIGARSFYARDWTVHNHIRGLLAERAGRYDDARRYFEKSLSLIPGWTRSNIELAKVDVRLGDPAAAILTLRDAYHQPLDAMGRYAPRSEMDFQMALAFVAAGQPDSARTYASYVRTAWVRADPEFRQRLALLP